MTVQDNETTELNVEMVANFAVVTLTTDAEGEIWIDGEMRGKGEWTGRLEIGNYTIEVKRESHKTVSDLLNINTLDTRTIQLKNPIPIYASLQVTSTPMSAKVYIDGVEVGETPLLKNDVLVGNHRVTFKKDGYGVVDKTVDLKEGIENRVSADLPNTQNFNITSNPSGANVSINGEHKGVTPFDITLPYGNYSLQFTKSGYNTENKTIEVNGQSVGVIEQNLSATNMEVLITSTPVGARLMIDGEVVGATPKKIILTAGAHRLELEKSGFKRIVEEVKVAESAVKEFNYTLQNVQVYQTAETMPTFPGGAAAMMTYLKKNIQYPEICMQQGVQGRVMVQFIIDIDGSVIEPEVIKPIDPYLDAEAIRVVSSMPKWTPGTQRGEAVRVRYTLPITFRLTTTSATSRPVGNRTYTVNGVSFTMVDVEGGTFTMGATSEQGSNINPSERPTHEVTLSNYSIGETEVTQELWQAVMGNNPSYFKGDKQCPVEQVSWYDCQEFIKKLNQLTGENFRLPTEAEWEYAARGGKESKGYMYSGSNTLGDVAWYDANSSRTTHVVKTKKPNELGIYDMSGNVWEWCSDRFDFYKSFPQTNPTGGPSSAPNCLLRGGSRFNYDAYCRVSYRGTDSPRYARNSYGLRLAK